MTTKLRYTKGTVESDNIHGYGWKDKMSGYEGDDILWGVGGWDTLAGGNGNDTLLGGAGSDVMGGGAGNDLLIGSEDVGPEDYRTMTLEEYLRKIIYDNDRLYGGAGDDTIYGGFGQDKLVGGSGRDYLDGGVGHDSLNGGSGNDMLHGGEGRDTLKGGAGGDVLDGGRGNDRVFGGAGDDLGVFDWGENVGFHNIYNGGRGVDYLRIKLTAAEWARADIKADILALAEAMADHTDPVTGEHDNTVFRLATTNLKVRGFENLQVMVDNSVLPTLVEAVNDHVTVQEDAPVTVLGSVLSNDVNAHLVDKVEVIWGPAQGTLVMDANTGNYTFDSSTAFTGLSSGQSAEVTFRYRITDVFGGTDEAVGRITVNGIDDVPVAADDYYTISEDEVLTVSVVPGLLSNDTSTIGTPSLTVQAITGFSALGARVTMNADGSFTYDPTGSAALQGLNEGQVEVDRFSYTVEEPDGDTAFGTAFVNVSGRYELPTAVDDLHFAVLETDVALGSDRLLDNDIPGTVGDTLSLVPGTVTTAYGATVVFRNDGWFIYDQTTSQALDELAEGEKVQDTFSYTVIDQNSQTDTATVRIEVTGVADLPTASPDSYSASEGVVLTVDAASGVLANDTTDGNAGHTIAAKPQVLTSATTGATLSLNADGSFVYDPTSSSVIEALEEGQFLTDSFQYTIEESDKDTATAEIGILVAGAAETIAPISNDYTYEDVEDTSPRTGMRLNSGNDDTLFDHVQKGAATDVLTMDFATEGSSSIRTDKGGTVFVAENSSFSYYAPYTKETALLNAGESFTDTFDFTVENQAGQSSTGTITLKLDGVDDNPDATDDSYPVYHYVGLDWNIPQHFGLLTNDTPHMSGDELIAVPMAVFDADPDKNITTLLTDTSNSATFSTDKGGVVTLYEDGSFTYETAGVDGIGDLIAGQKIVDSFDYLLLDEYYNGDVGTVTLDIMLGEYR
ncbi:Ig-like domain-containing protein [Donghicola tyrosinivorans]|uniref:VCBS repeat-containing protein n=1 Tax=Donghicola tyrosinivorans TaxID=1652492 RepID=A0A2T0WNE6_9RHOB|nr:Ig-like domain-containing protein [Donghicola tyrosinivorans]PRY88228.1 VCBS repeat-containing protein [Donghicola tyrosinivorans]